MKKAIVSVSAVLMVLALVASIVTAVLAYSKKTLKLSDPTAVAAARDQGVFAENVNVPYQNVRADYAVYVSPTGDDRKDGTSKENAVRTVKQAQLLVRSYFASHEDGNAVILLSDGEYYFDAPLALSREDVGGGSLYIRAEHNNKATISGSKIVDPSTVMETVDPALGRVWTIPCEEKINQLYVGESYGIRARFPDAGTEFRALNTDKVYKEILFDGDLISDFQPSDFEGAVMTVNIKWAESYLRVDSVKTETVRMNYTGNGAERNVGRVRIHYEDVSVFARGGLEIDNSSRCPFHFENSKAFLNQPGEWYFDEEAKAVLYLPREGETVEGTTLRLPHTDVLVDLSGSLDRKAVNVTFEGINFAYSANSYVDGKVGGQGNRNDNPFLKRIAGGVNDARPIAAISLENAENITFRGNIFTCLGGGAIDLVSGVKNITIEKNMFAGVGGNGVLVGATSTDINLVSTDERTFNVNINTENNYFTDIGWQEYASCAVIYNYSVDSKINRNTINNVRYTAISTGWGWDLTYTLRPFYNGVEIGHNRITGVCNLLADCGAIYTIGLQAGMHIHDNYIDSTYSSVYTYPDDMTGELGKICAVCGIYLDEASSGLKEDGSDFVVENNYVGLEAPDKPFQPHNVRYYSLKEPSADQKEEIYNASGVKEDGFTLLPKTAVVWGTRTDSATVATVYGDGLGTRQDTALILRDGEGKQVQLAAEDILSWTDTAVTFKSENYHSGEVFAVNKDGKASNAVVITLNVDREECMTGQFERFGGLSGMERDLQTHTIIIQKNQVEVSSTLGVFSKYNAIDQATASLWASANDDPDPWIKVTLGGKKVDKILLAARTDGADDISYRVNLRITVEIKKSNTEFETIVLKDITEEDHFPSNGILTIDLANTELAGKFIYSVKVSRTHIGEVDGVNYGHFLCLADIMFIQG